MSDNSAIEWCDSSWNPIRGTTFDRWMCQKISPGCDNCYASTFNQRWGGMEYPRDGRLNDSAWRLDIKALHVPTHWKRPRRIFVCSMTDLFGDWVSDSWLSDVFSVMRATPQHTYQILTKRPQRMRDWITGPYWNGLVLPNAWLGVSVELDRYAWRAKMLADIPAAVRFVSAEPLLGPLPSLELGCPDCSGRGVDPSICTDDGCDHSPEDWCKRCDGKGRLVDWLITGGESGQKHRPLDAEWVRDLRDRSLANGTAFFHKQNGGRTPKAGGRLIDGKEWSEYPAVQP